MKPLILRTTARYYPSTFSTAFSAEITEFQGVWAAAPWTIVWERHREYLWNEGQSISLRNDALKCALRYSELVGLDSPF